MLALLIRDDRYRWASLCPLVMRVASHHHSPLPLDRLCLQRLLGVPAEKGQGASVIFCAHATVDKANKHHLATSAHTYTPPTHCRPHTPSNSPDDTCIYSLSDQPSFGHRYSRQ
jgi:hypothetical protein